MTFSELAAAIDAATVVVTQASDVVKETEIAVEAFVIQKGMELRILQDDVEGARETLTSAVAELDSLYVEMHRMMPVPKVVMEPMKIGKLPSTAEMKDAWLAGQKYREGNQK